MKLKTLFIIFVFLCGFISLTAQQIQLNNFVKYNSMNSPNTATYDNLGRIWVGSDGGILIYDNLNNYEHSLTSNNVMLSASVNTFLYIEKMGIMVAGCKDGVLEFIDVNTLSIKHITGIRDYNFINPVINSLCVVDSFLYVGGGFGLAEFNLNKNEWSRTIQTLGSFPKNTEVNTIIYDHAAGMIWVGTAIGIAKVKKTSQISVPINWTIYNYDNANGTDLLEANTKICIYQNKIYAILGTKVYVFDIDGEAKFNYYMKIPGTDNYAYTGIGIINEKLSFSFEFGMYQLNNADDTSSAVVMHLQWKCITTGIADVNNNEHIDFVVLYERLGVALVKNDAKHSFEIKTPNSPINNAFLDMTLDKDGNLFAVSDNSQDNRLGNNIMMCNKAGQWINFDTDINNFPYEGSYKSIEISPDNKLFANSWGTGTTIIVQTSDGIEYEHFDNTNSALEGLESGSNYVVVGQTAFDSKGNAWITNFSSNNSGPMLITLDRDGNSYGFNMPNSPSRRGFCIEIDVNDTKWIATHPRMVGASGIDGLFFFNDSGTPENTTDDKWGNLNTMNYPNLLRNMFNCLVYDKFINVMWVGSDAGLSIINNTYSAVGNQKFIITQNKLLTGQHINHIFIDVIGNKWISTNNGLWVISVDGTELLKYFTKDNTILHTNEIQTTIIDSNSGVTYIGTKNGLYKADATIIKPSQNYDILTYPQPFNIKKHKELYISGLTSNSDIRITTPDGILIRSLFTSSNKSVWDGKDESGNIVQPGVYIIISSSKEKGTSGAAKVVINE